MDTLSQHPLPQLHASVGSTLAGHLPATPGRTRSLFVIGMLLIVTMLLAVSFNATQVSPAGECESLARIVARRTHSMLDGEPFRHTQLSAYRTCLGDPSAFRRMLR